MYTHCRRIDSCSSDDMPVIREDEPSTVGFHNFNLRIFKLRVSNPNELIVDVFLTRCRISMCQSLGPKKNDEISDIDRTGDVNACHGWSKHGWSKHGFS